MKSKRIQALGFAALFALVLGLAPATALANAAEDAEPGLATDALAPQAAGGEGVAGEQNGFSSYTVEFTYDGTQHVMQGDTTVALDDILQTIGLSGEVTAVEVSDESLFSASQEAGEWVVMAHQAFSSDEWMRVTVDGATYEIKVTDSGLDEYRYYYWSTGMSSYEIGTEIGISEEETLLGYLCFLCNGSTYNFTWDRTYPIKDPTSGEPIPWNANISGTTLTIRDTSDNTIHTETLSGGNNVWKIKVESVNQDDPDQSVLTWEQAKVGTYTVTYDKNYDDDSVTDPSSVTVPVDPSPDDHPVHFSTRLPDLTRDGYTFQGWYTEASGVNRAGGSGDYYSPTRDITLYAHWKGTAVTVDFGKGHDDFVTEHFGDVDGVSIDGATLTYEVSKSATVKDAYEVIEGMLGSDGVGGIVDNGELFLCDIALNPASYYASDDEVRDERIGYAETAPEDDITFYAQWAQPVGEVSVGITPPAAGTKVEIANPGTALERTNPQVEATVTGKATLSESSGNSWMDSSYDRFYEGTVEEGQSSFARIFLRADYGYYFASFGDESLIWADGTSVTVTNATGVEIEPASWNAAEVHGMVWTGEGPEPEVYNVGVDESVEGGTVTARPITAHEGDAVEVTIIPDSGYVLKTVTYTPEGSEAVSLEFADSSGDGYSFGTHFEMPAANVTVSATFDLENMVYVDFGAGHEDFAQALCGDDEDFEVNGSVVSFRYVDTVTDTYNAHVAYDAFKNNLDPDRSVDPVDDGVCYMYDIALHTRDYYAGEDELRSERDTYWFMPIRDGITFYALWADPVEPTITVTPPACGTEIKVKYYKSAAQAQPAPQFTVEGECHLDDYDLFYNSWDLSEYDVTSVGQSLVMKGGNSYKATGYLSSEWGYFMSKSMDAITVEGGTLESISDHGSSMIGFTISVPVSHDVPSDAVVVDPTCTDDGSRKYICSKCGEEVTEVIDALGHAWGEPTYEWSNNNLSCTATRVCAHDETHIDTKVANVRLAETKPATCEEDGEWTYTATFEDEALETQVKKVVIKAFGHDFGAWKVTAEPTCTEPGVETRTCTRDASHIETRAVEALGHDWGEWAVTTEPTCTEAGVETRTCAHDASHVETREVAALGHEWGEWTTVKEPTGTEDGLLRRTCARCGEVEEKAIPATGIVKATLTFDLAGGTLDGQTGTYTVVAAVGDTINLPGAPTREGYKFLYWKGSQYAAGAAYAVEGDHAFTAVWEAVAPAPEPEKQGGKVVPAKAATPKTGDASPLAAGALALAALAGLGLAVRRLRVR